MDTYQKYLKPAADSLNAYIKAYETYKAMPNTVVINEGKDDEYLFVREIDLGYFPITCVSREDFVMVGYNAEYLSEDKMRSLADEMGDAYVSDGGYWDYLEWWAEENGLPKWEDKDAE